MALNSSGLDGVNHDFKQKLSESICANVSVLNWLYHFNTILLDSMYTFAHVSVSVLAVEFYWCTSIVSGVYVGGVDHILVGALQLFHDLFFAPLNFLLIELLTLKIG